eukprot:10871942-Lingulodinium_polyedra.AAC.1
MKRVEQPRAHSTHWWMRKQLLPLPSHSQGVEEMASVAFGEQQPALRVDPHHPERTHERKTRPPHLGH